jgi:hypothetical protein
VERSQREPNEKKGGGDALKSMQNPDLEQEVAPEDQRAREPKSERLVEDAPNGAEDSYYLDERVSERAGRWRGHDTSCIAPEDERG